MKSVGLLKINESSIWHVTYSKFGFFGKKVTIFRKNLKIDNHSNCIKIKTRQNKELKNRRKNIVCMRYEIMFAPIFPTWDMNFLMMQWFSISDI